MKKKLHFLFSMVALMLVATFAHAQQDYTAKVGTAKTDWGGSGTYGNVTTFAGTSTPMAEFYGSSDAGTKLSQKVTGLDEGVYEVTVFATSHNAWNNNGATLQADANDVAYIFATANEVTLKEFFTARRDPGFNGNEPYKVTISNINVIDGELTLGLGLAKGGQTEWQTIQIYQLTRTGDLSLEGFVNAYNDALTAAKNTLNAGGKIGSSELTTLSNAVKTYDTGNVDETSPTELSKATAALLEANDAATSSASLFASAKTKLDAMKELADATNIYTSAAYASYYSQWAEKYEEGTLTTEEAQNLQDPSLVTGWHASITVDNFLLSAWDTKPDFPEGVPYYINTWSVEGDNDGTNFRVPFFEYFTADANSLGAKTLTATMTGLEPGLYEATAWVRNQPKKDVAAADITGITLQVNDGTPVDVTEGEVKGGFNIGEFSARGVVGEDGKLLIKFIVADNNNSHWLSFKNVKFTNLGTPAGDEDLAPIVAEKAVAAALGVDVSAYENLVILPFEVEGIVNELKEAEYVQVHADYTQNAASLIPTFDKWEGNMVSNKGQHWDGTATSTYYEQTGAQWSENNWTNNKKTTVNLPKGKYVLYAAGRASAGTACTAYIKVGEETRTYTSKGDVGFGVATDGTASFDPAATYANGNKGRGFEYRYVAFEVTADEGEDITLEIGGKATANHQWMSFTAPVLLTTAANAAIVKKVLAADVEIAQAVVEAKAGVGDDLFQKPTAAFNTFAEAVAAAKAVNEDAEATAEAIQNAVTALAEATEAYNQAAVNTPDPEKLYTFQLKLDGETPLYMNLTEGGITIAEKATPLSFVATENAGQFNLVSDGELYVGLAGGNAWTMSTAADKKAAWTFTALGNGEYNINNLVTPGRFVGTNAADKTAGTSCYADKQTSNGNVVWIIAEYVDPNDYTNMIVNADLTGEGGFDATGTKPIDGSGVVRVGNAAPFDFKQTIANLPAGQYKLTAQAAYRYGGDEAAEAAAIAGGTETKLVQLYATVGETTVATPVQNRYDGASETDYANGEGSVVVNEKYVPNSTNAVKAWFAAGQYVNEVIFNIAEAGDVTIGINRTGTPESDYTVIGPWTLTRLGDAVVPNPTYEIAIKGGIENGTVEADATEAEAGATVKLTITPAEGYELKSISISYGEDEDAKTIEPDEENSFIMPAAPVVIDAVFSEIIPDIVLSAPTFNAEEGTQAEPNMLPEGSTLKINYTAENLEANGLTADDVKVKVTVMVSGDLPEAGMSMGSTTAHRVMGETFYIPLGETDFPVALKPGYVYQNVAVMAAELVKPATDTEEEETLAAYVGASAMCHWVGIYDDLLIEIAQDQGKSLDEFPRTEFVEGDDYNTYTCTEGIQVAFKMFDIDVKDCDYVIVKFAEPVAAGWELAFWAHNDQSTVAVPAGATEYKYVFADDTKCAIQNGILPQICMLRLWSGTPPLEAKVTGVYKHYLGNEVAQEINVERYPGMGYTATEATVDFALAKRVLGVKEVTNDMLRIVNPDNTEISDYAPYDGWFNAEGVAEAWNASTTKVCAKFFQAIPNGTFEICDMNGADEVGKTYSVKWALVANDKKVVYTINVTFVEKPAIALTFDDLNVVDEKAADFSFKLGTSYQGEKATVDVAAILDKLEVESLSDVTIYAVQSDGSLDDNYKLGTTDGWRNAAGDWQGWGADAFFYVKANFAATENQLYDVGTMDPTQNTTIEAGTFTAKYAFVKGNDTHDAVVLSVNVALVDPVGINSIEIAKAKGNGKYLDKKGHIIIVNDNKAFSLNGIETE